MLICKAVAWHVAVVSWPASPKLLTELSFFVTVLAVVDHLLIRFELHAGRILQEPTTAVAPSQARYGFIHSKVLMGFAAFRT